MTPKQHIACGTVGSAVLLAAGFTPLQTMVAFSASLLIDLDHYVEFARRTRCLSFTKMFRWFQLFSATVPPGGYFGVCWLHTVEFLGLLLAATLFCSALWPLTIGFLFHVLCDSVNMWRYKALSTRAWSICYHTFQEKRQIHQVAWPN